MPHSQQGLRHVNAFDAAPGLSPGVLFMFLVGQWLKKSNALLLFRPLTAAHITHACIYRRLTSYPINYEYQQKRLVNVSACRPDRVVILVLVLIVCWRYPMQPLEQSTSRARTTEAARLQELAVAII